MPPFRRFEGAIATAKSVHEFRVDIFDHPGGAGKSRCREMPHARPPTSVALVGALTPHPHALLWDATERSCKFILI
jgi:hypothetical protein